MIWTVLICLSQLVLSQADQQILPLEAHQAILRARQNLNFYKNGNTSNLLELSRHMTPWAFSEKIVTLFGDSNQNLLTASSVSRGCLEEFRRVAEALVNKELWALQCNILLTVNYSCLMFKKPSSRWLVCKAAKWSATRKLVLGGWLSRVLEHHKPDDQMGG